MLLMAGLAAAPLPALAEDDAAAAPEGPTSYACEFKTGASWSFDGGKFSSKEPAALVFTIDNVDLDAQHAVLKGAEGAEPGNIAIARAIGANHFLEVATEGYWNITTIYDKDAASGLYPAVHSRHFGLVGQPVFSQYAGTCVGK